jgi:hypothetical protein
VAAFESRYSDCRVELIEHQVYDGVWDVWGPLRRGESDLLVDWLAADEPDLSLGPAIDYRPRLRAVARRHRLAGRARARSAASGGTSWVLALPLSCPVGHPDLAVDSESALSVS